MTPALPSSKIEDVLSGFNTLMISSLNQKKILLKFGQNINFKTNLSLFDFYKMHFPMIEKNISKKRENLSRNNRPEIGQPVRN